jgi:hypothetical protein
MHVLCTNLEDGTLSSRVILSLMGAPGGGPSFADRVGEIVVSNSVPKSHVWMMRHFTDVIAASKLAAAEQDERLKALSPRNADMPMFAKLLTAAWEKCHQAFRRDRAKLRCAMLALAVERYRLKHGDWPDDLLPVVPDFIPAIPADPCTDQPLKYRRAPKGISVYSVGPDHTLKGDFFDLRRPADPAVPAGVSPPQHYEFHLWDPDARLR